MKTFVVGDIHGQANALAQVLGESGFNPKEDKLIVLGDIVDGGPQTYEVVEILLTIDNIEMILGNHDHWFIRFLNGGIKFDKDSYSEYQTWFKQGGEATRKSYEKHGYKETVPVSHQFIYNRMQPYYIDDKNRLFVHGGIRLDIPIEKQGIETFMWDRDLIVDSRLNKPTPYKNIFVGHTDTRFISGNTDPILYPNGVILLDTGAGWRGGKLTLMDVDTLQFWQSQEVGDGR